MALTVEIIAAVSILADLLSEVLTFAFLSNLVTVVTFINFILISVG